MRHRLGLRGPVFTFPRSRRATHIETQSIPRALPDSCSRCGINHESRGCHRQNSSAFSRGSNEETRSPRELLGVSQIDGSGISLRPGTGPTHKTSQRALLEASQPRSSGDCAQLFLSPFKFLSRRRVERSGGLQSGPHFPLPAVSEIPSAPATPRMSSRVRPGGRDLLFLRLHSSMAPEPLHPYTVSSTPLFSFVCKIIRTRPQIAQSKCVICHLTK